jgi:hypothetical protein
MHIENVIRKAYKYNKMKVHGPGTLEDEGDMFLQNA